MSHSTELCREIRLDPRPASWSAAQREHAGACPGCRSFLASVTTLGERLLGLSSANGAMPAEMRQRLLSRLDGSARPAPRRPALFGRGARYLVPVAMAASLACGVVLGNRFDPAPAPPPGEEGEVRASMGEYIRDVTHDHFLFDRIQRPLEVSLTEAGPLSEWLSAALAFEVRLPSDPGTFTLEGGRVWHTVGRLSAMAVYRAADDTRFVLFAVPARNMTPNGAESQRIRGREVFSGSGWGHEARAWMQGDLAVSLTAPEGRLPEGWELVFLP